MGYYADGSGNICFSRVLKEEEMQAVEEILSEEFEDVSSDLDYVDFWTSDKYHDDNVLQVLHNISDRFPVSSGCVEYTGEDHCYWRFRYDPGIAESEMASDGWIEESGEIVYESDREPVVVLTKEWCTEENEGCNVEVYRKRNLTLARMAMRAEVRMIRQEWTDRCGYDPWQEDYTWENEDDIHLGFQTDGVYPFVNHYSWSIKVMEVQ